jgi:hypothetical protein
MTTPVRLRLASFRRGGIPRGCLIALAVTLAIFIAVIVWVAMSWRGWAAGAMKAVAVNAVDTSTLSPEQKQAINTRIEQVVADWKDKKITTDQLGDILKAVAESPVMPLAMVGLADQQYVVPSTLPEEEKQAGRRSLQRFARGMFEKTIPKSAAEQQLDLISTKDAAGNRKMKQTLTPEELRTFLASAKAHADAAKVPDEPYTIDYAKEINKAIDSVLARPGP